MIRMLKTATLAGAAFASLSFVATAHAADLQKGREKADQVCAACHGKDGNTTIDPSYPKLAGQAADYLVEALKGYKNESRKNAIMVAQAKALSSADIKNLAAYYASLPGQISSKKTP
jgi:cytochrome c553